jgi:cellulose synthase/poly-beta-1,6-N-acetylglucosamine synthase-like glycosyltransferase
VPDAGIRLCAAAGRFVGTHRTSGDLVLFLDGDHELCPGWLAIAMRVLDGHPDVGVVGGFRVDVPKETPTGAPSIVTANRDPSFFDAAHAGPAALYRRSVLERSGTFLPFLISDEEPELCVRVRHAGYRVVRTVHPVVVHRTDPEDTFAAMFARRRRRLYLGFGQNLRYHAKTGLLIAYLRTRPFALPVAAALALGLACLLWSIAIGAAAPFVVWLAAMVLMIAALAIRRRSVYSAVHSLVHRLFILEGSIRGLRLPPLDPDAYLRQVETVR